MKTFCIGLAGLLMSSSVLAQHESGPEGIHVPHGPHHLSVLIADTHVSEEGDNFTVGVDYEYRVSPLLGIGAVVEYAFGELEATTVLAVADVHLNNGIIVQVGPGFENRHSDNVFVARIGMLYEFEMGNLTLSPQLHWDYHNGEANAVVAGVALGFAF
ncbi:MAG: hypothetical protein AB8B96_20315 [Lysobacterales bacterium]